MPRRKNLPIEKTVVASESVEETLVQFRPQKSSNITPILLVLVSFFAAYLFFKVQNLEKQIKQPTNQAQQQQQNPGAAALTDENLKKYAKDLKLDTGKFNACLDKGDKKTIAENDSKQASSLQVGGTPGFFINGRFLGGAFPFEMFKEIIDKEVADSGSDSCKEYSTELQKYCDEKGANAFNPIPKTVDLGNAPATGSQTAKVTIIEFSDFECPFCARAYPTVKKILQTYPSDVKFYYKHLPLISIHPRAQKAAEASVCAQDQGKFWEYHDKLFTAQGAPAS